MTGQVVWEGPHQTCGTSAALGILAACSAGRLRSFPVLARPAPLSLAHPACCLYCCCAVCTQDGEYGRQRLWGSLGWGLLAPAAGLLIARMGLGAAFLAFLAASAPCAVIALYMDFPHTGSSSASTTGAGSTPFTAAAVSGDATAGAAAEQQSLLAVPAAPNDAPNAVSDGSDAAVGAGTHTEPAAAGAGQAALGVGGRAVGAGSSGSRQPAPAGALGSGTATAASELLHGLTEASLRCGPSISHRSVSLPPGQGRPPLLLRSDSAPATANPDLDAPPSHLDSKHGSSGSSGGSGGSREAHASAAGGHTLVTQSSDGLAEGGAKLVALPLLPGVDADAAVAAMLRVRTVPLPGSVTASGPAPARPRHVPADVAGAESRGGKGGRGGDVADEDREGGGAGVAARGAGPAGGLLPGHSREGPAQAPVPAARRASLPSGQDGDDEADFAAAADGSGAASQRSPPHHHQCQHQEAPPQHVAHKAGAAGDAPRLVANAATAMAALHLGLATPAPSAGGTDLLTPLLPVAMQDAKEVAEAVAEAAAEEEEAGGPRGGPGGCWAGAQRSRLIGLWQVVSSPHTCYRVMLLHHTVLQDALS